MTSGSVDRGSKLLLLRSTVPRPSTAHLTASAVHRIGIWLTPSAINTAWVRLSSSAIDRTSHIWLAPGAINRGCLRVRLSPAAIHRALTQLPAVRRCLSTRRRRWSLCWPPLARWCTTPGNSILAIHPTGRTGLAALPLQSVHFCVCTAGAWLPCQAILATVAGLWWRCRCPRIGRVG